MIQRTSSALLMGAIVCSGWMSAGCSTKNAAEAMSVKEQALRLRAAGVDSLKQGESSRAVQEFVAAIALAPDDFESTKVLAETFIRFKQFERAKSLLIDAARRFPENPGCFYLLAASYRGAGDLFPEMMAARKSLSLYQLQNDKNGARLASTLLKSSIREASKVRAIGEDQETSR